jgi:hypothetical protein
VPQGLDVKPKLIVQSLEDVPEALRPFYVKDAEGDTWRLQLDEDEDAGDPTKLARTLGRVRTEKETTERELREAKAELEKLRKAAPKADPKPKTDDDAANDRKAMAEAHRLEQEASARIIADLEAELYGATAEAQLSEALIAAKVTGGKRHFAAAAAGVIRTQKGADGKRQVLVFDGPGKDAKVLYNPKTGDPMTPADWVAARASEDDFKPFFPGTKAVGSGTPPANSPARAPASTMSPEDKLAHAFGAT